MFYVKSELYVYGQSLQNVPDQKLIIFAPRMHTAG